MENCEYYMRRREVDDEGNVTYGEAYSLEEYFEGMKVRSVSGVEDYGQPATYTETYAESNMASVYVDPNAPRTQTDITLTCSFHVEDEDDREAVAKADAVYHAFVKFISGCQLIYWDNVRQRRARMFLPNPVSPKTDTLYNTPYKDVEFKFKNVFGCTFSLDDDGVYDEEE